MGQLTGFNRAPQDTSGSLEIQPEIDIAPMVAIGGLLTIKRVAGWYTPLLNRNDTSGLPARERFIPPPYRGLAGPDKIRTKLTDNLERLHEKLGGEKMYLVGHSLGALLATMTAVERPDMVAGVSCLGGVHAGIKKHTLASFGLRHMLGNPEEAELLMEHSTFMQNHLERMRNEWPADIPMHVVSTVFDTLVVPPQGFGLELASDKRPDEKLIIPRFPGAESAFRKAMHIDKNVQILPTSFLTEHINLPVSPAVIQTVDEHRRGTADSTSDLARVARILRLPLPRMPRLSPEVPEPIAA